MDSGIVVVGITDVVQVFRGSVVIRISDIDSSFSGTVLVSAKVNGG